MSATRPPRRLYDGGKGGVQGALDGVNCGRISLNIIRAPLNITFLGGVNRTKGDPKSTTIERS